MSRKSNKKLAFEIWRIICANIFNKKCALPYLVFSRDFLFFILMMHLVSIIVVFLFETSLRKEKLIAHFHLRSLEKIFIFIIHSTFQRSNDIIYFILYHFTEFSWSADGRLRNLLPQISRCEHDGIEMWPPFLQIMLGWIFNNKNYGGRVMQIYLLLVLLTAVVNSRGGVIICFFIQTFSKAYWERKKLVLQLKKVDFQKTAFWSEYESIYAWLSF